MEKVALYARVSKEDSKEGFEFQNPDNQIMPLRDWAKAKGWELTEFIEKASGGSDRPVFQDMLGKAMQRQFGGIIFYSIDRFSREGILDTLTYIKLLRERGVWLKSLREEWLDTEGPFTELMLAQFAWFAQFERKKISDRTKAGLARRKNLGMKLGRPPTCPLCGWLHKTGYVCKEPKNEAALARLAKRTTILNAPPK